MLAIVDQGPFIAADRVAGCEGEMLAAGKASHVSALHELIFLTTIGFMFTHELDAIRQHEWRILPLLDRLDDEHGFVVFTLAHVPLFMLIVWLAFPPPPADPSIFRAVFAGFCVVHAGLHKIYEGHREYGFKNRWSRFLIRGAALAGAAHLLLMLPVLRSTGM